MLWPLARVFQLLVALRRRLFRLGWLTSGRIAVPVVVIGNITVGGSGKTPLTIHLARELAARGRRPGIVSRGYRGAGAVREVFADSPPAVAGDEPVLLARRSGCPVVVGHDRVAAAQTLLATHPACDVILCDDGLQHYRLHRDLEIAVFDGRGVMNGWLLPAGPLREPVTRLREVDAVVCNGGEPPAPAEGLAWFSMGLRGEEFWRLGAPETRCQARDLAGRLHAVAGIGDPDRFFTHLRRLGLAVTGHAFPDHHDYRAEELDLPADALLTTEKDAVKLTALALRLPVWVLPVTAVVEPDLTRFVLEKLHGSASA